MLSCDIVLRRTCSQNRRRINRFDRFWCRTVCKANSLAPCTTEYRVVKRLDPLEGYSLPKSQDKSKDDAAQATTSPLTNAAMLRDEDHTAELRRLAALQKLRELVPQDQPRLDGLCRVACLVTQSHAAGLAFMGDRFLYFASRFGHLPDRDVRGFAIKDLYRKLIFIPEARLSPGFGRINCFNGKFAAYQSMIAVAVHYEEQPVAMLACYSEHLRQSHATDVTACLNELAALAEAQLALEATLSDLARTAAFAVERVRVPAE